MLYDMHVHSEISADSDAPFQDVVDRAFEKGLGGLCFTEHIDFGFPGANNDWFSLDFERYSAGIEQARRRHPGKWIGQGLEVGMLEGYYEPTEAYIQDHALDFVIGSVHVVDGIDPFDPVFFEGRSKGDTFMLYLKTVWECINSFSNFNVLGHLSFPSKIAPYDDNVLYYNDAPELIDSILKNLIKDGKGMEINTSAYLSSGATMPHAGIVRRYKELGGDIITLASDAHKPDRVAQYFTVARDVAKQAGFDYACRFENRKPVFYRI